MLDFLESAFCEPFLDIAVGGRGRDAEDLGEAKVFLAVKAVGKGVGELELAGGFADRGGSGILFNGRELAEDLVDMDNDAVANLEGGAEVLVGAVEGRREFAGLGDAQGRKNEDYPEGGEAHSADGGDNVFAVGVHLAGLDVGEVGVEAGALVGGHLHADALEGLQELVQGVELFANLTEVFVEGHSAAGIEDVVPFALGIEVVEHKAGEEAVLGVLDEAADLGGRAGEEGGEAGRFDADIFLVLAADVGDGFVVEGFAEAVGVVAVVGVEGVGESVAFCLEHQAFAVVLVERLIDGGGAGVGRDEEKAQRRFFGLLH